MPAQNYRIALLVIIAAITLPVFSAEPAPVPVLNQTKLDRFVNEVEAITADSIIASAVHAERCPCDDPSSRIVASSGWSSA